MTRDISISNKTGIYIVHPPIKRPQPKPMLDGSPIDEIATLFIKYKSSLVITMASIVKLSERNIRKRFLFSNVELSMHKDLS